MGRLAAKTRWFLDDLMSRPLLSAADKDRLYEQYAGVLLHVHESLREQFRFLPEESLDAELGRTLENCRVAIEEGGFFPIFGRVVE